MTEQGPSELHVVTLKQTVNTAYYVSVIPERTLGPAVERTSSTGGVTERRLKTHHKCSCNMARQRTMQNEARIGEFDTSLFFFGGGGKGEWIGKLSDQT